MNAPLRRLAMAVLLLFGLLFANLNYVQFVKGGKYRHDPRNRRVELQAYARERGPIVVDREAIAVARPTGGQLKYLRVYPAGRVYAQVTGFKSLLYGSSGIEAQEESILSGDDDRLFVRRVSDIVTGRRPKGGSVVLTLDKNVQQAAYRALANRKGAVVVLDPKTGAIRALVSGPTYDPGPLASHDTGVVKQAWKTLNADPDRPLLDRALSETFPPGSTFKVVVSAAALGSGYTPATMVASPTSFTPPQTSTPILNFEKGANCGATQITLEQALTVSCNTAYAELGVKLGADAVRAQADKFGFDRADLTVPMAVAQSQVGTLADTPSLAQSSIGQRDVRMTPLQGAMIAAAVANNGIVMKPYLIQELQSPDFTTLSTTQPDELSKAMTPEVAGALQTMMRSVVENPAGTGRAARISGVTVAGKTGTAQNGPGEKETTWFIGYAAENGVPVAAVAVVLDHAGGKSSAATTVAADVLRAATTVRTAR